MNKRHKELKQLIITNNIFHGTFGTSTEQVWVELDDLSGFWAINKKEVKKIFENKKDYYYDTYLNKFIKK